MEKVLLKTFHELNGKMVEVKRAVPKELSPGPIRSQLGGFNYGLSRVNNLFNAFNQGYAPSTIGGYGVRMDGRFSPVAGGRSGFPPFGSGYGMGMNFEPGLGQSYGGSANFNNNLNYGRGANPYYISNTNRFSNTVGYDRGNGGNSSFFSSATRNLWGNGGLNFGANSPSSNAFTGSANGTTGGAFGHSGSGWGSSLISAQGGGSNISSNSGNLGYGGGDSSYGLGAGGYGRNSGTSVAPTSSYAASNSGYDAAFAEFYNGGSVYGESTWRPPNAERDGSGSFGYELGNAASDVPAKSSPGYVGGYSVTKRQSNRGNSHTFNILMKPFLKDLSLIPC